MEDPPHGRQEVPKAWPDPCVQQSRGAEHAGEETSAFLQLRRLSYMRTFQASVLGCVFSFLGLILLGLGESRRLAGSPPAVLRFRSLAWLLMYQLPVHVLALPSVRALAQYGTRPDCGLVPGSPRTGDRTSAHTLKARLLLFVLHGLSLLVFVVLTCVPFHPEQQFLGYVLIYGVGHVVSMAIFERLLPVVAPFRHARYGWTSGAPTLGVAIMGFFFIVSGFSAGKRRLGAWFGGSLAVFLFAYENVGTNVVCKFYTEKFIKDVSVREAYSGTVQALTPSIAIALIACMSEGARLTVLIAGAMLDPEDDGYKVALGATLVMCVLSRTGYLDACVHACFHAWAGSCQISNARCLLRQCRFQSGYPRILLVCTLGMVRTALGGELSPNSAVTNVVLLTLLETVVEDVLIVLMKRMGMTYEPQLHPSQERQPAAVVPEVGSGEDGRGDDVWLFQYGFEDFPELPFWAHFAPVMISQFHTVLFIFIFCGGVPSSLGLCDYGYTGIGRGIVWWPIEEVGHLCK